MEVTIKLLEQAMGAAIASQSEQEGKQGKGEKGQREKARFLVDGFPRQMDQAVRFDESVGRFGSLFLPLRPSRGSPPR